MTDGAALIYGCIAPYMRHRFSPVHHISTKDFTKSITENVTSTQHLIACVDPLLRAKCGVAVYCSDDAVIGGKFFANYGASKAAQSALFKSWAIENQNSPINIIEFTPKPMPTATRARFYPGEDTATLAKPAEEAKRLLALIGL